jgi:hypothetical protein
MILVRVNPSSPALLSSKPRIVMQDEQMQRDPLSNFCARLLDEDIAASPTTTASG